MQAKDIAQFLEVQAKRYNRKSFIIDDPISVPHQFTLQQDIEISGLFAAVFSWGNRTTILNKCAELLQRFQTSPYDFVMHHTSRDLKRLEGFKHRTFNDTDLLYFVDFLHRWYQNHLTLEIAFTNGMKPSDETVENGLNHFRQIFFEGEDVPQRTRKHISSPEQHSACKRMNMYLRWMVRRDQAGVDFGIWKKIKPAQLICPLDVHVHQVASQLGILTRKQADWQAALELTSKLKKIKPKDPVYFDYALFGTGVNRRSEKVD